MQQHLPQLVPLLLLHRNVNMTGLICLTSILWAMMVTGIKLHGRFMALLTVT